jgi:SAM-dependent methyltransferase
MEPTEENIRAFEDLHRLRIQVLADRPGVPDAIRALLPDIVGKHVLHLMCGTGEASAELAELGALVTGVDVWADALVEARERYPNIVFVHSDPHELPLQLQRRRLDLVYAGGGVLRYVHDLGAVIGGANAALRSGGELLLWDTHPALECLELTSLRWREDYFAGTIPIGLRLAPERTVSLWRLGEVVSAVAAGGFVVRRLEEFPSVSAVRTHDPRVPGEFALLALKPGE